jgi:23S rRNA pseudouridine2457 synthase
MGSERRTAEGRVSARSGPARYILFNKPDGVLTQFRPVPGKMTISDFGPFPRDVHPVGRLDEESEGLLLLTNDGEIHHRLIEPRYAHRRTYLVQVERVPDEDALRTLRSGVLLGGETTLAAEVRLLHSDPGLWPKRTPIRFRKTVPTAWLEFTIKEGKNRQIRRMTAAVGHPALRVVRMSVGPLLLDDLRPGESRELTKAEVRALEESLGRGGSGAPREGAPRSERVRNGRQRGGRPVKNRPRGGRPQG